MFSWSCFCGLQRSRLLKHCYLNRKRSSLWKAQHSRSRGSLQSGWANIKWHCSLLNHTDTTKGSYLSIFCHFCQSMTQTKTASYQKPSKYSRTDEDRGGYRKFLPFWAINDLNVWHKAISHWASDSQMCLSPTQIPKKKKKQMLCWVGSFLFFKLVPLKLHWIWFIL